MEVQEKTNLPDIHSIVHHNFYGDGEVTGIIGENIYVSFGVKRRIFSSDAFGKTCIFRSALIDNSKGMLLDASKMIGYAKINEGINAISGTNYKGWMWATWPHDSTNAPYRLWFPKLAINKNGKLKPAANDCLNTISDDWNVFVYDDLKESPDPEFANLYSGPTLIFAKDPNGEPYIFRGVYVYDYEKTIPKHHVFNRIGSKVKVYGPSEQIEILDDWRNA